MPQIRRYFRSENAVLCVAATDLARFEIPDLANCAIFLLGIGWVVSSGLYSDAILDAVLRAAPRPQQRQAVGPGTITRSRGRCAGNGLRKASCA